MTALTQILNLPLALGTVIERAGYFTKRDQLGDLADGPELERRIGYAPGTLALGWYVLMMIERPPVASEFVLAGYSHFSDGRIRGHVRPQPGEARETVEESLHALSVNVLRARAAVATHFTIEGPQRLVKIHPLERCHVYWHPDPNPVAQWQLTVPMRFRVAEFHAGWTGH
jgi:hypothetical protein